MLRGSGIAGHSRLLKLGREMAGRHQFQEALLGRREKHIIGFELRIQPKLLEFRDGPIGVVLVVGRSDMVRARAEPLHVGAQVGRIRNGAELGFPVMLGAIGFR